MKDSGYTGIKTVLNRILAILEQESQALQDKRLEILNSLEPEYCMLVRQLCASGKAGVPAGMTDEQFSELKRLIAEVKKKHDSNLRLAEERLQKLGSELSCLQQGKAAARKYALPDSGKEYFLKKDC